MKIYFEWANNFNGAIIHESDNNVTDLHACTSKDDIINTLGRILFSEIVYKANETPSELSINIKQLNKSRLDK